MNSPTVNRNAVSTPTEHYHLNQGEVGLRCVFLREKCLNRMSSCLENQEWISFCYHRAVAVSLQKEISCEKTDDVAAHVTNSRKHRLSFAPLGLPALCVCLFPASPAPSAKPDEGFFFSGNLHYNIFYYDTDFEKGDHF